MNGCGPTEEYGSENVNPGLLLIGPIVKTVVAQAFFSLGQIVTTTLAQGFCLLGSIIITSYY